MQAENHGYKVLVSRQEEEETALSLDEEKRLSAKYFRQRQKSVLGSHARQFENCSRAR